MPDDPIEREVKLAADPQFGLPDLGDLVKRTVGLPQQRLMATYFDTPDYRLWSRKMTLRHRIGEGVGPGVWTLKLPRPSVGIALTRTELEWAGPLDRIPVQADEILRGIVRRSPLQKVASLETARRRVILQGRKQSKLAELDDDTVTIHGGTHDGVRFRQIELELDEADDSLLEKCVERLQAAGAWIDDRGPKLAHALDESAATITSAPPLGPKASIGDVVRMSIQSGFNRILDYEYLLRVGEMDPPVEAVHQTRVAARRLRSDLKTFDPMLDHSWVSQTRDELRWLGGALGLVRDADVLAENLDLAGPAGMGDGKGRAGLRRRLQHQRRTGAGSLAEVLKSERYLLLLDRIGAAADRPPFLSGGNGHRQARPGQRASKVLPSLVTRPWKDLRRDVRRAGEQPTDQQLHRVRIRAKQLRYAAEVSEPVIGKRARRIATASESLQTRLGEHHDAVIAEGWLRDQANGASSEVAFSAGYLACEQRRRQRHLRRGWRREWKRINRHARAWLTQTASG